MLTNVRHDELPQLILPIRSGYAGSKEFCCSGETDSNHATILESLKRGRKKYNSFFPVENVQSNKLKLWLTILSSSQHL